MKINEAASYQDGPNLYVAVDAQRRDDLADDQSASERDKLALKEAARRKLQVQGVAGSHTIMPIDANGDAIDEQRLMTGQFTVAGYRAMVKLAVQ